MLKFAFVTLLSKTLYRYNIGKQKLALKVSITTAADDKLCGILLDFGEKTKLDMSCESPASSYIEPFFINFRKEATFEI